MVKLPTHGPEILIPPMTQDTFSKAMRREIMSRVRNRDTVPEMLLRRALWKQGGRYRLYRRDLPGTPDVVFVAAKVAVFVDSDFWHGRVPEERLGQMSEYWQRKLRANRARDEQSNRKLASLGWKVMRFTEREVRKDAVTIAKHIMGAVDMRRTHQ